MKVCFVSDLFEHQIVGGAEKNDAILIQYLKNAFPQGLKIHDSRSVTLDHIQEYDFFIISNFIMLPEEIKQALTHTQKYIIYEHDHKYVSNRNPATFIDYKVPPEHLVNVDFYRNAKEIIVLSKICKDVLQQNLQIENVHSIGCSLWSDSQLDLIKNYATTLKEHEYGVLNSTNPVKGTRQALEYCKSKSIEPELINSPEYEEFLQKLAQCTNFIFFPQVLETYSRVCVEAKMLECNVLTMPKLCGFFSEECSKMRGVELIEEMRSRKNKALEHFKEVVDP
tara:strand:- start:35744 stop:36586 length:843 start_codon:yes stop_codon:yes gene_type:complete